MKLNIALPLVSAAVLLMLLEGVTCQIIYNSSQYTLGPDLLPDLPFNANASNSSQGGNLTDTDRWICHQNCDPTNPFGNCLALWLDCNLSEQINALDLDSTYQFDNVTHTVAVPAAGEYVVYVQWIPALLATQGKSFRIKIGNLTVFDITTNTTIIQLYTAQNSVSLTAGSYQVSMQMYGTTPDSWGVMINKVTIRQLLPISHASTNRSATSNNGATSANSTSTTNNINNTNGNVSKNTSNSTSTSKNSSRNNQTNIPSSASNGTNTPTNSSRGTSPQVYKDTVQQHAFDYLLNGVMLSDLSRMVNKVPGNRILFNFLTEFMDVFDRFYLYYYHHQKNTYYAEIFLRENAQFTQNKSSLCYLLIQMCANSSQICLGINSTYNSLLSLLSQKYNYTDSDFLSKNSNGVGFFANHLDFIYFQLPFLLLNMFIFYQIFEMLFKYRISVFFRKYSFYAIIFFMVFEGNVEQFAFDIFCELKLFMSINFTHKVANVVILLILFVIIIFSVSSLLWMKFHYKKLVKYFVEYYSQTVTPLIFESCQRMVFPLILGGVHAFAIQNFALQSLILAGMQMTYLVLKMLSLRLVKVKEKMKVVFSFVASGMRILFIMSFYVYQMSSEDIVNDIHRDLIIVYIGNWGLETLISLFVNLLQLFIIFKNVFLNRCLNSYSKILSSRETTTNQSPAPFLVEKPIKKPISTCLITNQNPKIYLFERTIKKLAHKPKLFKKDMPTTTKNTSASKSKAKKKGMNQNYLKIKAPHKQPPNKLVIKQNNKLVMKQNSKLVIKQNSKIKKLVVRVKI